MAENLISYEPATGTELWRGQRSNVAAEVAAAHAAWPQWAARPLAERIALVEHFAEIVRARHEEMAVLIARETGKPLWETRTEVDAVINKVAISIQAYAERTPEREVAAIAGQRTWVRHKPHGVMAVLGPYNFPAHLPNGHIIPALIAGNSIVFKPSEKTPATGAYLVDCLHAAGIPEDVVRLVIGGVEEGRALVAHPHVEGILFTGSARTGIALNRQFADQPGKMLALEMGGNNPIIVWDAEDAAAAALVVQSAYLSAGQRCTAASRLIVCNGQEGPLIDAIYTLIDRIIIDNPFADPAPFMGPVIDMETANGLLAGFAALEAKGGRVIRPLTQLRPGLPFLSPALIDMTDATDRPDEELFGPVLQIIRVADFEAAIREANATAYGLAASLIGGTEAQFHQAWAELRAGVINWNRPTNGAPSAAPFGGLGLSGNHRPSAYYAADYCAYPVVSVEGDTALGTISTGLRPLD
ncbi:MAG: N-succinylglutamate 5-semialdehyde dehydrogenase [Pseudomonadota bacterium]|jgi:succinylglutamic semialdehyde dehydrogenase